MKYNDLTVKQMLEIQAIEKTGDELNDNMNILTILFGEDILSTPVVELKKMLSEIDLTPVKSNVQPKYIINGKCYALDTKMDITTSQYIDYCNYKKDNDIVKMLSVFLIPEGHTYNDGYDIFEVIKDIEDMKWVDAEAIGFFFIKRFALFTKIFLNCLEAKMKKNKMTETEQNIINILHSFNNSVSSLML